MPTKDDLEETLKQYGGALRKELGEDLELRDTALRKEFGNVSNRLDLVGERFQTLTTQFQQLQSAFYRLEERQSQFMQSSFAQVTNARATLGRDKVFAIGIPDLSSPFALLFPPPEQFPRTVLEFWCLQSPRNIEKLFYFCQFYGVKGEDIVGDGATDTMDDDEEEEGGDGGGGDDDNDDNDDDDADSSSSSQPPPLNLHAAVRNHPPKALACLAFHLALDYDKISYNMDVIRGIRENKYEQRERGFKRAASPDDDGLQNRKRTITTGAEKEKYDGHQNSGVAQNEALHSPLPLRAMLVTELPEDRSSDTVSKKSMFGWASYSSPGTGRQLRDEALYRQPDVDWREKTPGDGCGDKGDKRRSQASIGSTIVLSDASEELKEQGRKKPSGHSVGSV